MNKNATKISKKIKNEPKLADILNAVNDGFTIMEARFQAIDRTFDKMQAEADNRFDAVDGRFREVFTVLDGHTKKLEGLEQEKYFTFHAVQRLERDIEKVKKILHLSS